MRMQMDAIGRPSDLRGVLTTLLDPGVAERGEQIGKRGGEGGMGDLKMPDRALKAVGEAGASLGI